MSPGYIRKSASRANPTGTAKSIPKEQVNDNGGADHLSCKAIKYPFFGYGWRKGSVAVSLTVRATPSRIFAQRITRILRGRTKGNAWNVNYLWMLAQDIMERHTLNRALPYTMDSKFIDAQGEIRDDYRTRSEDFYTPRLMRQEAKL